MGGLQCLAIFENGPIDGPCALEKECYRGDNDKGECVNGSGERPDLCPPVVMVGQDENLFEQMPGGTGNREHGQGNAYPQQIIDNDVGGVFFFQLETIGQADEGKKDHQNRPDNIDEPDGKNGDGHYGVPPPGSVWRVSRSMWRNPSMRQAIPGTHSK